MGGAPEDVSQKPRARAAGAAGATTVAAPRTGRCAHAGAGMAMGLADRNDGMCPHTDVLGL